MKSDVAEIEGAGKVQKIKMRYALDLVSANVSERWY
jgi:hypothetical protein